MTKKPIKEKIPEDIINKYLTCKYAQIQKLAFLYHYTDGPGFLGIIEQKEIWAGNILYMNDTNEFKSAFAIAKNLIDNIVEEDCLKNGMLDYLRLLEDYEDGVFVTSFSEKKDLLSQWRAYSGDYGFSIGFKIDYLKKIEMGRLKPCIYDKSTQEQIIKDIIKFHVNIFQNECDPKDCGQVCQNFAYDIVRYSPIIKDKSFDEECEWRLISDRIPPRHDQVFYRSGKTTMIPYFKFKCPDLLQNIEVIVGPSSHQELTKRAARNFLYKKTDSWTQKTPGVYSSPIPFRNWKT